jgi:hypothetical protein|tara:strand:+ start:151 stop:819 length:669 start_codon:yes stop_codon:yes gene_type:complete
MALNINGTTGISGVDGSVSAPAVTGTDSNTGITFPSADTIKFATGGVERMSITNSGVSGITAGITSAQQFRLAADQAGSGSTGTVLTNWEESDTDYQSIGSNWSQSSGIFSCSATGIYLCTFSMVIGAHTGSEDMYDPNVQISTDSGSNYNTRAKIWAQVRTSPNVQGNSPTQLFMFDVANTSTFRLRYRQSEDNDISTGTTIKGGTNMVLTHIMFIRLGDT